MARPISDETAHKVTLHINNGYRYATLRPRVTNEATGKRMNKSIHLGTVTESLKFIPGKAYLYMPPAERKQLVFPQGWDLSELDSLPSTRKAGRPSYNGDAQNRLYGDVWLMERVAEKTKIREDLEKVFEGNKEKVDDIMTLAMFPYISNYSYSRLARWQRYTKTPSTREMSPGDITRLTQSITEKDRQALLRLRSERIGKMELCAVDSTSRSAYGSSLADIRWGHNKENIALAQTNEVVVYTLSNHMPIYYRSFPGNIPDSRTMSVIQSDLRCAGFMNYVMITDRGYGTVQILEDNILHGQPAIMCMKTGHKFISDKIDSLGNFNVRPDGMEIDLDSKLYYKQYDIDYKVHGKGKSEKAASKMRLNLFFNPSRRSEGQINIDMKVEGQRSCLHQMLDGKEEAPDDKTLKRDFCMFDVKLDKKRHVVSFEKNEKKYNDSLRLLGFVAIVTLGLDLTAPQALAHYKLRDEQEKYFQQMKTEMCSDRQRNWSEDGKTGRLFVLFVGLVIGSYIRHTWKTTDLHSMFASSLDMLDEMRNIRCIERQRHATKITPFVGKQVEIAKAFGLDIPVGCEPGYKSKKVGRKRGRPKKNES